MSLSSGCIAFSFVRVVVGVDFGFYFRWFHNHQSADPKSQSCDADVNSSICHNERERTEKKTPAPKHIPNGLRANVNRTAIFVIDKANAKYFVRLIRWMLRQAQSNALLISNTYRSIAAHSTIPHNPYIQKAHHHHLSSIHNLAFEFHALPFSIISITFRSFCFYLVSAPWIRWASSRQNRWWIDRCTWPKCLMINSFERALYKWINSVHCSETLARLMKKGHHNIHKTSIELKARDNNRRTHTHSAHTTRLLWYWIRKKRKILSPSLNSIVRRIKYNLFPTLSVPFFLSHFIQRMTLYNLHSTSRWVRLFCRVFHWKRRTNWCNR